MGAGRHDAVPVRARSRRAGVIRPQGRSGCPGLRLVVCPASSRCSKPFDEPLGVLRQHRDAGYWETVITSGGHPALVGSIQTVSGSEIYGALAGHPPHHARIVS